VAASRDARRRSDPLALTRTHSSVFQAFAAASLSADSRTGTSSDGILPGQPPASSCAFLPAAGNWSLTPSPWCTELTASILQ
jgi:hypothetical protein